MKNKPNILNTIIMICEQVVIYFKSITVHNYYLIHVLMDNH